MQFKINNSKFIIFVVPSFEDAGLRRATVIDHFETVCIGVEMSPEGRHD